MTNDLKAKSQEFIELGKKITQGEWEGIQDQFYGADYLQIILKEKDKNGDNLTKNERIDYDLQAISQLPELIDHIIELQKRLDDYERQINVCESVYYCETSPTFLRWKKDVPMPRGGFKYKKGDKAGSLNQKTGNGNILINGFMYLTHRAVLILHGIEIPDGMQVDHIDGNPSNSRIDNLRVVTPKENSRNRKLSHNNKSGYSGIKRNNEEAYISFVSNGNGKKEMKYFSFNKYTEKMAFEYAVTWRLLRLFELNKMGYGYTDRHVFGDQKEELMEIYNRNAETLIAIMTEGE
jgi:hypothetical protein